jgi:hypothetical protein
MINLHIERLVLQGLPITHAGRARLREVVEAQLAALFSAELSSHGRFVADVGAGGALASIPGGTLRRPRGDDPARLGDGLARAIHAGITTGARQLGRHRAERAT